MTVPEHVQDAAMVAAVRYHATHAGADWSEAGMLAAVLDAAEEAWPHGGEGGNIVRLERRSLPEQLRYLAGKLAEGTDPVSVAFSLEAIANEQPEPDPPKRDPASATTWTATGVPSGLVLAWRARPTAIGFTGDVNA